MVLETIRTIILATGWPLLIAGSIYILTKAWLFYDESKGSLLARLVFPSMLGWLVTMYSLGIVATFYMFDYPRGVLVVLPIFLIWFVTFVAILTVTLRWSREAAALQKAHNALEAQAREQYAWIENAKRRERELAERIENTKQFYRDTAKKIESPLNAILWNIEALLAEKNIFPSAEATIKLKNARQRAEELKAVSASITKPHA